MRENLERHDHGDVPAGALQIGDGRRLLVGQHLRVDAIDGEFLGDGLRNRMGIAGQHHDFDPGRLEPIDRLARLGANRIGTTANTAIGWEASGRWLAGQMIDDPDFEREGVCLAHVSLDAATDRRIGDLDDPTVLVARSLHFSQVATGSRDTT